ncbi:MAG: PhnD/SsuA/transferrin family substrate-binding protein [Pseudomonadota bacterium]
MIAALEAYDWPEVQGELDRFWHDMSRPLRRQGINAPEALERDDAARVFWQRSDVLIGQTCSRPYRLGLHRRFSILGSLRFAIPGCENGFYCSRVITRAGLDVNELAGGLRLAVNSRCSQSGWAALQHWLAANGAGHQETVLTGSHRASVVAVARGRADVAAIDAVSWHLATRFEPASRHVVAVGDTPLSPGLPLVTARRNTPLLPHLRDAAMRAARAARRRPHAALPIIGFAPAADRLYRLQPYRHG